MNFYNENDPRAAAWLRSLIDHKLIPNGHVDERSIKEVQAKDLSGYANCHFFAGIGGWSYALQLAGWPDDVPVWTGSCPCQPLSCAGQRAGEMDERHLWPDFYRLIAECRPATVFEEQVASSDGLEWLDGVSLDLEELGYAVGAADLPAASAGAPHKRQRLWWVADSNMPSENRRASSGEQSLCDGVCRELADATNKLGHGGSNQPRRRQEKRASYRRHRKSLGNPASTGLQERSILRSGEVEMRRASPWEVFERAGGRRIEPGLIPLAHGIPGRMDLLRGYGNAIVPQVAAKFIQAYMKDSHA